MPPPPIERGHGAIGELVGESAAALRARPWALSALGLATLSSLAAVCCGLGLLSVPFFLTEMMLVQLAVYGTPVHCVARDRLVAMAVLSLGVLSVVAAMLFAAIWAPAGSSQPSTALDVAHASLGPLMWLELARYALFALGTGVLWLPLLHTPPLLLTGGYGGFAAIVESARLLRERGVWLHVRLWLVVAALSWLPALLIAGLVHGLGGGATWVGPTLSAFAVVTVTLPLGQGVLVAAHARMREPIVPPVCGDWPRALKLAYGALLVAPVAAAWLLLLTLWTPAPLLPGALPAVGGQQVLPSVGQSEPRVLYLVDSDLTLRIETSRVVVAASDGGGAGPLPLRSSTPVAQVRAVPLGSGFGIEVRQPSGFSHTHIDSAGVRLDDSLRDRLADRLPPWAGAIWLLTVLVLYLTLWPVLAQLGQAQRDGRGDRGQLRRAVHLAFWLSSLVVYQLFWPLEAWFRGRP